MVEHMKNPKLFLREYQYYRILNNNNESTFEFDNQKLKDRFVHGLVSFDIPHTLTPQSRWGEFIVQTYIIEDWKMCTNICWMIQTPSITPRKKSLFLIACCKYLKLGGKAIKTLEDFVDGNTTVKELQNSIAEIPDVRSHAIISEVSDALRYIANKHPTHPASLHAVNSCLSAFYNAAPHPIWRCDILRHIVKRERFT